MKFITIVFFLYFLMLPGKNKEQKIFDVHLHGSQDIPTQLTALEKAGVYKAALSSSWEGQDKYRNHQGMDMLFGLMLPCPNGKVPYSLQPCFEDGKDWPALDWVEQQIKLKKIDFLGEVLSQYYGISPSDSLLFPYYALAEKYDLPVGIHTGGAGPGHGSPDFKIEMGNPKLIEGLRKKFPGLRLWIMHSGDQFYKETIGLMLSDVKIYSDISVISNPDIVPHTKFSEIMKEFIDAGLEDRLLFGTDNGDVEKVVHSIVALHFLTSDQKQKIYYKNAERFFKE